ncbi:eukaryotic translation initiation factor 3 subunit F-like, partial [Ruditapes philippinarum]|uniref:eukaryotic translation initiation factor 3 subunit F-like n=1 Tax=Ruditapes philippinarum TaxID=129788 RepID=UPI00295A8EAE
MAVNLVCRIHPVVLFTIVDSYERRNEDARRVIGTLLGTHDKGVVEVTNAFAVPHNESEDEVAADLEYARNMFELHKKVNPSEVIVGCPQIYSRETDITNEQVFIFTVDVIQGGKFNPKRSANLVKDLTHVERATGMLQQKLAMVLEYVEDVLVRHICLNSTPWASLAKWLRLLTSNHLPLTTVGSNPNRDFGFFPVPIEYQADNVIGRFLMDLVMKVPQIEPEDFEEMLNSNMK